MASPSFLSHYTCEVPFSLLAAALHRSSAPSALRKARQLHAIITTTSPSSPTPFLFNTLLSLYSKLSSLPDARNLFDTMRNRNLISYNTMISAYSKHPSHSLSAFHLFHRMLTTGLNPNASTFTSLVSTAAGLQRGTAVHSRVISSGFTTNVCIQTALIGMYAQLSLLEDARLVFDEMGERDAIAWNSIMYSYVKMGDGGRGLGLFCSMIRGGSKPNLCTYSIALNACARAGDLDRGRIVHGLIVKSEFTADSPLRNALLGMYGSCGDVPAVESVFERIEIPGLISWNSLLAGYAGNGEGENAMDAFVRLRAASSYGGPGPDEYTFSSVVSATVNLPSMNYGKPLHAQICKVGLECSGYVGTTLITMYFVNGEPDSARKLFVRIPDRDAIIWTEMIIGHSRAGEGELAMRYFYHMQEEGHKVDSFSLSSALNSSAELAALKQGEITHSLVLKSGYEGNMCVGGALVDMYVKGGNLEGARSIFRYIQNPDLKCWNSLIGGYGNHGDADEAFKFFSEMTGRGLEPDHVTYVSLLSACSHSGLVERGRFYWFCMTSDGINPGLKHYTCMVSLLARTGHLHEAEEMIVKSPIANSSPEPWRILLSWCVTFKNLPIGVNAAEQALSMEPDDGAAHILLSNLYASAGRWESVAEVRKRIRELNLEKDPGLSWIEMNGSVHVFSADDDCQQHVDDCRDELLRLQGNLREWETTKLSVSL